MDKVDHHYVLTGFAYALVGMIFGAWMGASQNLHLVNSHAHINLVGFVMLVLVGLVHRLWPVLKNGSAAKLQFWLFQIGVVTFLIGKIVVDNTHNELVVVLGSLLVVIAVGLLGYRFMRLGAA
ncbi:MAG: hypothetical protein MEP57_04235 [Microvirga sp.]|nr:hypothetical protein [Microvirga sp.]